MDLKNKGPRVCVCFSALRWAGRGQLFVIVVKGFIDKSLVFATTHVKPCAARRSIP